MDYAGAQVAKANTVARENVTLADHINSIDANIAAAQEILSRVAKLADHIGGPIPQSASEGQPDAPEDSALNLRLRRKLNSLNKLQSLIYGELGRLEAAV